MCSTFSGVVYQLVGLVPGATGTWPAARGGIGVEPVPVGPNEEKQLVDALVGPDVGDVLDVFRGGVPARGAGARGHGHVARRAGGGVGVEPVPGGPNEEKQLVDALV